MSAPFVTRFAPSPTGYLHLGHAFSALTAFDAARAEEGRFVLRIEDIDETRCKPEFEAAILEDLAWLGLTWETPVMRQSERLPRYRTALETLTERGLAYRCFKTRKEILAAMASAPHGPGEVWRGTPLPPEEEAERMAAGESFAWRLSLDAARDALGDNWGRLSFFDEELGETTAHPETAGDIVLARKDIGVAYHLAVVVDDADQGVNHVIRGEDLREACHIQRLLQALLDLPTPRYRHHRLILNDEGKRLAKRDEAQTLRSLRASGVTPVQIRKRLGL